MIRPSLTLALIPLACLVSQAQTQSFAAGDIKALTEEPALLKGSVTVVTFVSARCPVSNAYGDRLEAVYKDYAARGVRFLFVNSNANEAESEIAENAKSHGFSFPIYHDKLSLAAERFHAQFTPEAFVIGPDGQLQYHGAVDDAQNPARVVRRDLREALDAVLAGRPVDVPETKAFGCTIKRARKTS